MSNNFLEGLMSVTMENLKQMVDVNTIVGDAVESKDGMTIIPVSKVSFGFGVGGSEFGEAKENDKTMFGGGSGGGVTIDPIAFLVVGKEQVRLMPMNNSGSTAGKIIDAVPDLVNKFSNFIKDMYDKKKDTKEADAEKKAAADFVEKAEEVNIVLED